MRAAPVRTSTASAKLKVQQAAVRARCNCRPATNPIVPSCTRETRPGTLEDTVSAVGAALLAQASRPQYDVAPPFYAAEINMATFSIVSTLPLLAHRDDGEARRWLHRAYKREVVHHLNPALLACLPLCVHQPAITSPHRANTPKQNTLCPSRNHKSTLHPPPSTLQRTPIAFHHPRLSEKTIDPTPAVIGPT